MAAAPDFFAAYKVIFFYVDKKHIKVDHGWSTLQHGGV